MIFSPSTPSRKHSAKRLACLAGVSALALGLHAPIVQAAGGGSFLSISDASDDLSVLLVGLYTNYDLAGFTLMSADDYLSASGGSYGTFDPTATPDTVHATGTDISIADLSGDGTTVVGRTLFDGVTPSGDYSGTSAFVWTATGGFTNLGWFAGGQQYSFATAVDYDGTAVAGGAVTADEQFHAFYWQVGDDNLTDLGTLSGETSSWTSAISGDGTTVIGYSGSASFVWSVGDTAITDIGTLGGGTYTTLVSFDGDVVAGYSYATDDNRHAIRWTDGQLTDLGTFGGDYSQATAMSRDGDVIVGSYYKDYSDRAFRWVVGSNGIDGTMSDLGSLGSSDSTTVVADISADGGVVVGYSDDTEYVRHGFRWSEDDGMISVDQWLRDNGVTLTEDMTRNATMVSSDGNTVIGETTNGQTYIARVVDDSTGIITMPEYLASVSSAGSIVTAQPMGSANTIMFGAQGSPMRNLLAAGQKSVYGTVDSGYDNGASSDGGLLLGDLGFAYGVSDGITLRLSAGGSYSDQDLDEGGDFQSKGWYISPEVSANVAGSVYLTVGGYYSKGKLDINRGYLNGTATDYSTGETDTETYAGKIRLDWLNAFTVEEASFTPYAALSRTNSKTDAYSESGGAFPVSYDESSDHSTVARIGLDAIRPLNATITLLARAEVAYRFEKETAGTSGEIIGLSAFDLEGQDVKQLWLRGGIGAEMAVAGGTASLMLNATTEGDDPNVWLRSGWKVDF